jgi:nitronate monooxygenase
MFHTTDIRSRIVQAPLAGGASTPELTVAVSEAGAFGFLAAGYKAAGDVAAHIAAVRAAGVTAFGVNVFAPPVAGPADPAVVAAYVSSLDADAERFGVAPGEPRFDDDGYEAKLELLLSDPVAVVSFTFGCPAAPLVDRLHAAGTAVWVTVTEEAEALEAVAAGADALVLQGVEAGGHRGSFADVDGVGETPLDELLAAVVALGLPAALVAAGGIATRERVAAVLAAGASAAAVGTAFMLCPESGTSAPHREALAGPGETRLTRAFSGRRARGIVNAFMDAHDDAAPSAYPEIHHVTAPIRAAARAAGDASAINLWAGTAHEHALELGAAEVVRRLTP